MTCAKTSAAFSGRSDFAQRWVAFATCAAVLVAIVALIAGGYLVWLSVFVGAACAVAVAYRFPVVTVAALVALGLLPLMFLMTPWQAINSGTIGRVPIQVLPLLPMAGAVAVRITVLALDRRRSTVARFLPLAIGCGSILAGVVVFGAARGMLVEPLPAMREVATSYLGLIIVPYFALFLTSSRDVARVFKTVAVVGVGVPLVLLPVVGQLKGWEVGSLARFFPSIVHMGILYGLVTFSLLQARERAWRWALVIVFLPALFLIIVDGHRSVWMAAAVAFLVLLLAGRIRFERFWKWGSVAILVVFLTGTALAATGMDPVAYVASRGKVFSDPGADATASWRLSIWRTAIKQGERHLVLGEGFGSYYDFATERGTITVSPHNLYVQTFLKLGIVGLLAYVGASIVLLGVLVSAWKRARRLGDPQLEPIILMGVVAVCASLAYGLAYSFEVYSMIFVGLGLAAALRSTVRANSI